MLLPKLKQLRLIYLPTLSFQVQIGIMKITKDIFWEESMHGIYPENVGVSARLFKDEDDFFDYLDHSAILLRNVMDKHIIFIRFRPGTIWLHLKSKHML